MWTTPNGSGTTQGWERVPYWLRGYIDMGYCLQSATVISNAARWIKGVMNSVRTNGYFGPAQDYGDAIPWHTMIGCGVTMLVAFVARKLGLGTEQK
jgi:hypothetical protein